MTPDGWDRLKQLGSPGWFRYAPSEAERCPASFEIGRCHSGPCELIEGHEGPHGTFPDGEVVE